MIDLAVLPPSLSIEEVRMHCSVQAASHYDMDARLLWAVSVVEGGHENSWVLNTNGTHDLGYMQFNTAYLKTLSSRYGIRPEDVLGRTCYPFYLAAWRISEHLAEETHGDKFYKAAAYHSRTDKLRRAYASKLRGAYQNFDHDLYAAFAGHSYKIVEIIADDVTLAEWALEATRYEPLGSVWQYDGPAVPLRDGEEERTPLPPPLRSTGYLTHADGTPADYRYTAAAEAALSPEERQARTAPIQVMGQGLNVYRRHDLRGQGSGHDLGQHRQMAVHDVSRQSGAAASAEQAAVTAETGGSAAAEDDLQRREALAAYYLQQARRALQGSDRPEARREAASKLAELARRALDGDHGGQMDTYFMPEAR